jgi:hypothetical protein
MKEAGLSNGFPQWGFLDTQMILRASAMSLPVIMSQAENGYVNRHKALGRGRISEAEMDQTKEATGK